MLVSKRKSKILWNLLYPDKPPIQKRPNIRELETQSKIRLYQPDYRVKEEESEKVGKCQDSAL